MTLHLESAHDGRQIAVELHVDHRADDLRDSTVASRCCCGGETPGLRSFQVLRKHRVRTFRREPLRDVTARTPGNLRSPEELP